MDDYAALSDDPDTAQEAVRVSHCYLRNFVLHFINRVPNTAVLPAPGLQKLRSFHELTCVKEN